MADSKVKKEVGVNFDYILALKSDNGILSVEKIDITRHYGWVDEMIEMYEAERYDASDMYHRARYLIQNNGNTYPFCLGHEYYESYIDEVAFPVLDTCQYRKEINERLNHITNCFQKGYIDYANRLKSKLDAYIKRSKEEYLKRILPYIYSYDYNETLREHNLKEKYTFFSSEIHGRFTYETVVNEDLKILTRTNFCYGGSTYFHIIVKYKDVELLPLSEWVKYYYAEYNSIMRYTRSYICIRDSWKHAMDFLEGFVNKAIENPDEFVKKDVICEVNSLMEGLDEIFHMTDNEFEKRLEVNHIEEDEDRYIGISSARHANERDREYYKIRKSESAMVFKMEKISGALHFLNNLKSISEIIPEVNGAISRIIELNNSIYPNIIEALPPISHEIKDLTCELHKVEREYNQKEKRLEYYKNRLENIKKKSNGAEFCQIEQRFKENNPQFEILINETEKLWHEQNKLLTRISDREGIKKRLLSYKELIEKVKNDTGNQLLLL